MLESLCHSSSAFVTLTYAEDKLPAGASLVPKHAQLFLKRFRKMISPSRVRFFLVGEYGDVSQRPHYHAVIFGWPGCDCSAVNRAQLRKVFRGCAVCTPLREAWGFGIVDVGHLTLHSAQYVSGYVVKKMTRTDDPRLAGRWPEFTRMSLRPGLGREAMHEVASSLMRFNLDTSQADVPVSLRHGAKILPLGRYLRRYLRTLIGKEEGAPAEVLKAMEEELSSLYVAAAEAAPMGGEYRRLVFADKISAASAGKIQNLKGRLSIKKGGSI